MVAKIALWCRLCSLALKFLQNVQMSIIIAADGMRGPTTMPIVHHPVPVKLTVVLDLAGSLCIRHPLRRHCRYLLMAMLYLARRAQAQIVQLAILEFMVFL